MFRKLIPLVATLLLVGCSSNPVGGNELNETGKVVLQATARIAFRHYLQDHPGRAQEIATNVRAVAAQLADVTEITTVGGLRVAVQAELDKRISNQLDRDDAHDLLDAFEALLKQQIGNDEIDSAALVRVNEFAEMLVKSLPAV